MKDLKHGLYNTWINESNAVGWCWNHKCWVTEKQMRCKGCVHRNCRHFKKKDEHPIWAQRAAKNKDKKRKRKELWEYVNGIN